MSCILILGGTADGRHIAAALDEKAYSLIYSVAGLVRQPKLNCEVISGGFSQFGGLESYINSKNKPSKGGVKKITAILDVTHPYAQTMSNTARDSAKACGIPYWRFHRLAWQAEPGDKWRNYENWADLLVDLKDKKSVFLTAGQIPESALSTLDAYGKQGQQQILRTAVKPGMTLPPSIKWHKAIGPFALDDEKALMQAHQVDALVSKNSGGHSTQAKLFAARQLAIPVLMFTRPELPPADEEFTEQNECIAFIDKYMTKNAG